MRRGSRDVIETAVSQLFDAAVRHPHGVAASGEYRIDDLARLAGTTTRNIRVYRDRGLLHPPLRVGRIALFNDTHLTRLRLITSMLDRGYNIAHVHEMLSAWEQGKDLGEVLGLESAIAGTWAAEKPQTMPVAEARRLIADEAAFDRLVGSGLIRIEDDDATVVRPKLIEAFNDIREYGVSIDKLIDIHEQVLPLVDQISAILVQAGAEHVQRPDQARRRAAGRHRGRRIDHHAGAVPDAGGGGGHCDAGLVDRVDDRGTGQPHPRRLRREFRSRRTGPTLKAAEGKRPDTPAKPDTLRSPACAWGPSGAESHSHSMVPGGLLVTSSTTRFTSGTSLVMRVEMRSRTS